MPLYVGLVETYTSITALSKILRLSVRREREKIVNANHNDLGRGSR